MKPINGSMALLNIVIIPDIIIISGDSFALQSTPAFIKLYVLERIIKMKLNSLYFETIRLGLLLCDVLCAHSISHDVFNYIILWET